jgi:hypothetical protein
MVQFEFVLQNFLGLMMTKFLLIIVMSSALLRWTWGLIHVGDARRPQTGCRETSVSFPNVVI